MKAKGKRGRWGRWKWNPQKSSQEIQVMSAVVPFSLVWNHVRLPYLEQVGSGAKRGQFLLIPFWDLLPMPMSIPIPHFIHHPFHPTHSLSHFSISPNPFLVLLYYHITYCYYHGPSLLWVLVTLSPLYAFFLYFLMSIFHPFLLFFKNLPSISIYGWCLVKLTLGSGRSSNWDSICCENLIDIKNPTFMINLMDIKWVECHVSISK